MSVQVSSCANAFSRSLSSVSAATCCESTTRYAVQPARPRLVRVGHPPRGTLPCASGAYDTHRRLVGTAHRAHAQHAHANAQHAQHVTCTCACTCACACACACATCACCMCVCMCMCMRMRMRMSTRLSLRPAGSPEASISARSRCPLSHLGRIAWRAHQSGQPVDTVWQRAP